MLKQTSTVPLTCLIIFTLSFIMALSYIAVMDIAPVGELEIRFRYLEKYYNRGDNGTVVNFSIKAGLELNNVTLHTREAYVRSVLFETAATTPITVHAWDQYGFTWDHTVTVLELIDDHWIDTYLNYRLGDKYCVEISFSWSRLQSTT